MKENKVITDIEQLTPEWLTNIFKNKGYLSQGKVTKIIKKKSQETITSFVYFLELNFSTDAQTEPPSRELVVKISKHNDEFKIYGRQEAKFYNIIAENMIEMPIPTCYDAVFSEETGLSHIILENISKTHETLLNFPFGPPPSKQHFEKAIDSLAEIHAFWWDHKNLKELSKQSRGPLSLFLTRVRKEALQRFLEDVGDKMSDNRKSLLKKIFSLYPQAVDERIAKKNLTIIHTDAHLGQFFYPKNNDNEKYKAILSDWQGWNIGVGGLDLAYMIGLFLSPENRRLMEKKLIKRYHSHLIKLGIKNYNWDKCWYDYKLFTFLNIYHCIWWWNVGMVSSSFFWARLETSIATIEDLNCMELLES
ncbi:MAG: oxidoreductase family protein [Candidatus Hodarchaeota archaeon]